MSMLSYSSAAPIGNRTEMSNHVDEIFSFLTVMERKINKTSLWSNVDDLETEIQETKSTKQKEQKEYHKAKMEYEEMMKRADAFAAELQLLDRVRDMIGTLKKRSPNAASSILELLDVIETNLNESRNVDELRKDMETQELEYDNALAAWEAAREAHQDMKQNAENRDQRIRTEIQIIERVRNLLTRLVNAKVGKLGSYCDGEYTMCIDPLECANNICKYPIDGECESEGYCQEYQECIEGQCQYGNIAPIAEFSATSCNTGPCSTLNDLDYGTCGKQEMWIDTEDPPSQRKGDDWIKAEWEKKIHFNRIIIYHGESDSRFLSGGIIQIWNNGQWMDHHSFHDLPMQCKSVIDMPRAYTDRFRITAFEMEREEQTSNPNFREIEVRDV